MFVLRLIFIVILLFVLLMTGLGVALALRVRQFLQNPFLRQDAPPQAPPARYDNVIEGEYTVVEIQKDK